jgi:alpha-1,2-mannosyltransferase
MVPGNGLYWMNDYQLYYESGQSILQGTPLYDLKIGPFEYPFTYTPFAAILLASLSIFSIPVGQILWFTTNLIALALCCWISLRMMGINKGKKIIITAFIVACSSLILDPILCHQFFGQINIFIMLLVLIDFYHGLPLKLRGIFTGIAAVLSSLLYCLLYISCYW